VQVQCWCHTAEGKAYLREQCGFQDLDHVTVDHILPGFVV